jgi:hypothetical protein
MHSDKGERSVDLLGFDGHSEKRVGSEQWRKTESVSGGGFWLSTRPRRCG